MEYRCWVESAGQRQRVGKMFFGGDLAYWVGPSPAVAGLVGDATFGVSLVDAAGAIDSPEPVLVGADPESTASRLGRTRGHLGSSGGGASR